MSFVPRRPISHKFRWVLLAGAAVVGVLISQSAARAATIEITSTAAAFDPYGAGNGGAANYEAENILQDTVTSGDTAAATDASMSVTVNDNNYVYLGGYSQTSTTHATASVDAVTGELKLSATNTLDGYYARNFGGSGNFVRLTETFLAVGSGVATAFLAVSGSYSFASGSEIYPNTGEVVGPQTVTWGITGNLGMTSSSSGTPSSDILNNPQDDCVADGCTSASGSVSRMLTASVYVENGSTLTISAILAASLSGASGFVDLGHTGLLYFTTTSGLTLTPSDSRFLSDPAFVAPVPIPAALPLLASGLGALGFIGWRRKRRDLLAGFTTAPGV